MCLRDPEGPGGIRRPRGVVADPLTGTDWLGVMPDVCAGCDQRLPEVGMHADGGPIAPNNGCTVGLERLARTFRFAPAWTRKANSMAGMVKIDISVDVAACLWVVAVTILLI